MTPKKLCIDCKHFITADPPNDEYAKCGKAKSDDLRQLSLVVGVDRAVKTLGDRAFRFASIERSSVGPANCGQDATWFTEKGEV